MREFVSQSTMERNMKRSTEAVEHFAPGAHHISVNNQPRSPLPAPRSFSPRKIALTSRKHLQALAELLKLCQDMSVSLCAKTIAACLAAIFIAAAAFAQGGFTIQGGEYQYGGALLVD